MALSPMQDYFPERKLFHGFVPLVMGTKLDALLVGPERSVSAALWERAVSEAQRLNAMLNRFDPLSEVSRLNAAADSGEVAVSEDLLSLIQVCETYRERTGGLFDIARGSCGEGILILPGSRVALQGGSLDFGGFAKGWFLRVFRSWLLEAGVGSAYVDFGGSTILALGTHPFGASWRVRVVHPYTGSVLEDVDLVDRTLSTSFDGSSREGAPHRDRGVGGPFGGGGAQYGGYGPGRRRTDVFEAAFPFIGDPSF